MTEKLLTYEVTPEANITIKVRSDRTMSEEEVGQFFYDAIHHREVFFDKRNSGRRIVVIKHLKTNSHYIVSIICDDERTHNEIVFFPFEESFIEFEIECINERLLSEVECFGEPIDMMEYDINVS